MRAALLILSCLTFVQALAVNIDISEINSNRKLAVSFVSNGGHMENCLRANLVNKNNYPIYVTVNPGTRFSSADTNAQDIIIVQKAILAVAPRQQTSYPLYGFCTQLTKSSPVRDSKYSYLNRSETSMAQLCELIDSIGGISPYKQQQSVWVLSDGRDVGSVFSIKDLDQSPIYQFLCDATGQKPKWYCVDYQQNASRIFHEKPTRVEGAFSFTPTKAGLASIIIYNRHGGISYMIQDNHHIDPAEGERTYPIRWLPKKATNGNYDLKVFIDGEEELHETITL